MARARVLHWVEGFAVGAVVVIVIVGMLETNMIAYILGQEADPMAQAGLFSSTNAGQLGKYDHRSGLFRPTAEEAKHRWDEEWQKYLIRHRASLEPQNIMNTKFIVWEANQAGLGNRFPGIVSCILIAILRNRTFLVEYGGWNQQFNTSDVDFDYSHFKDAIKAAKPNFKEIGAAGLHEWFLSDFKNRDEYDVWRDIMWSYRGFGLWGNKHFRPDMERIFLTPQGSFGLVFRSIAKLRNHLLDRVAAFKAAHFRSYNIGIQVRSVRKVNVPDIQVPQPDPEKFAQVALALRARVGVPFENVTFFIATDHPDARTKVIRSLGESVHVAYLGNSTVDTIGTGSDNPGTDDDALVDLKLLSECDVLVVTQMSSYGPLAAAFGSVLPVYVNFGEYRPGRELWKNWFWGAVSSEPCLWEYPHVYNAGGELREAFLRHPFWMEQFQCHYG